ncbi:hypothetical protein BpHYR1_009304 [Brachionus plicatilis]|uniref:Uncharacterized protein n=1 Tax=Brachionus plicatilis TaxID=10195 RepID=A0A3M7R8T9_BRAPC|nr:hypothetical protein BpHYR1_009304 [Brachionus plicatilis]
MPSESKKSPINFIEKNVRLSRLKVDSLKIDLSKSRLFWSRFRTLIIFNSENIANKDKSGINRDIKNVKKIISISFRGLPERLRSETVPVSSYRFLVEETHFGDTPNNLAISFCFLSQIFRRPTIYHFCGLDTDQLKLLQNKLKINKMR